MPTAWVTCTACTYVINKAKSYVVNNETISHFVGMLEEVRESLAFGIKKWRSCSTSDLSLYINDSL